MKQYKVVVLGGTGMLGHAVVTQLREIYGPKLVAYTQRSYGQDEDIHSYYYDVESNQSPVCVGDAEYVINCIGAIKPRIKDDNPFTLAAAIRLNSEFPIRLAEFCQQVNTKLIHITTDCVFDGLDDGMYTEKSPHTAIDGYGRTKSLGEMCKQWGMVIRTSIIGTEPNNQYSLVEWVREQNGKHVNGYTNHWWNGITTTEFAMVCYRIMDGEYWRKGLYHVTSPTPVSKYQLVLMIAKRLGLDITLDAVKAPTEIDRTMVTLHPKNIWAVDPLGIQIARMPDFNPPEDE